MSSVEVPPAPVESMGEAPPPPPLVSAPELPDSPTGKNESAIEEPPSLESEQTDETPQTTPNAVSPPPTTPLSEPKKSPKSLDALNGKYWQGAMPPPPPVLANSTPIRTPNNYPFRPRNTNMANIYNPQQRRFQAGKIRHGVVIKHKKKNVPTKKAHAKMEQKLKRLPTTFANTPNPKIVKGVKRELESELEEPTTPKLKTPIIKELTPPKDEEEKPHSVPNPPAPVPLKSAMKQPSPSAEAPKSTVKQVINKTRQGPLAPAPSASILKKAIESVSSAPPPCKKMKESPKPPMPPSKVSFSSAPTLITAQAPPVSTASTQYINVTPVRGPMPPPPLAHTSAPRRPPTGTPILAARPSVAQSLQMSKAMPAPEPMRPPPPKIQLYSVPRTIPTPASQPSPPMRELQGASGSPLVDEPREGAKPGNRWDVRTTTASSSAATPPLRQPVPLRPLPQPTAATTPVLSAADSARRDVASQILNTAHAHLSGPHALYSQPSESLRKEVERILQRHAVPYEATIRKMRSAYALLKDQLDSERETNKKLTAEMETSLSQSVDSLFQSEPPKVPAVKVESAWNNGIVAKLPKQEPVPLSRNFLQPRRIDFKVPRGPGPVGARRPGRGKLSAGASRRPIDETHQELLEKNYHCPCYAPKPLIYTQLGVAKELAIVKSQFAMKAGLMLEDIRVVEVERTAKITTARGEISMPVSNIKDCIRRESETMLLLVCKNTGHTCEAMFQTCLVVVWEFWDSASEAAEYRERLLKVSAHLEPLKRRAIETDTDMIHSDEDLGATFFAGCGWNRFQKGGGCKWNRSERPRRFEAFEDPQNGKSDSEYSDIVYRMADRAADLMKRLIPVAYDNMTKVDGHHCRLGTRHRLFSAGSINSDACLKPHRDRRDTNDGCGALLSWQLPQRPTQLHYIFNMRRLGRPQSENIVAIDLGYGSCTFEVAGVETHATTPPEAANRRDPARMSYVLFQHSGLNRPHHGRIMPEPPMQSSKFTS